LGDSSFLKNSKKIHFHFLKNENNFYPVPIKMPSNCKTKDCGKSATYGLPGSKSRIACSEHKTPDMECRRTQDNRKCLHCDKRPSYALPGEKPKYCMDHAPEDMINTKAKMCVKCEEKQPSFGFKGKTAMYCGKCAKTCDFELYDLVSKLCEIDDCQKNVLYGFPGTKPKRCILHKEDGMIDLKNKKKTKI
jgi:hypothetical protein